MEPLRGISPAFLLLLVPLLLPVACAKPPKPRILTPVEPSPPPLPANSPVWLQDAMSREGALAEPIQVAGEDFHFSTSAQATDEIVRKENHSRVRLGVESTSLIECLVVDERILDLAGSLERLTKQLLDEIEKQEGALKARRLFELHAGSVDAAPYLGADWIYVVEATGSLGMVQQRIARKGIRSLACHHIGVGYRNTFERVFSEILETLEFDSTGPRPSYQEVWVATLDPHKVGVQSVRVLSPDEDEEDEEEPIRFETSTSFLVPIEGGGAVAIDTTDLEFSTSGGLMVGQRSVRSIDGKVVSDLRLEIADGDWEVSGVRAETPIELTLPYKGVLASQAAWLQVIRRTAADHGIGSDISTESWSAEVPDQIVQKRVLITGEQDGQLSGWLILGESRSALGLAPDFGVHYVRKRLQSAPVDLERIYVRGEL